MNPNRYRSFIFWTLATGYLLVIFHRLCPAAVATEMMRDLDAGGTMLGLLGSAYFYPYALLQLPAGLLSDSWGPRKTVSLFLAVAGAGSLMFAVAPTAWAAVAARVVVGVGVAMVFVPTLKIMAEWYETDAFAGRMGMLFMVSGIGTLVATEPLARAAGAVGWRAAFAGVGVVTLAVALAAWRKVRDTPGLLGFPAPKDHPGSESAKQPLLAGLKRVFATPAFWPIALWFFCTSGAYFALVGMWGGPYLIHIHTMTSNEAGRVLAVSAVGLTIGGPTLAWLSNRVFHARKPLIVISSVVVLATMALLAGWGDDMPRWALMAGGFALGMFATAIVSLAFTLVKELFPTSMAGTATGAINLFPFAGAAVFQPVLGRVIESHGRVGEAFTAPGYHAGFLILLAATVVAFLASLFLRETTHSAA